MLAAGKPRLGGLGEVGREAAGLVLPGRRLLKARRRQQRQEPHETLVKDVVFTPFILAIGHEFQALLSFSVVSTHNVVQSMVKAQSVPRGTLLGFFYFRLFSILGFFLFSAFILGFLFSAFSILFKSSKS